MDNYLKRKIERTNRYFKNEYKNKLITCTASGYYDHNGSPVMVQERLEKGKTMWVVYSMFKKTENRFDYSNMTFIVNQNDVFNTMDDIVNEKYLHYDFNYWMVPGTVED